MTKLKIKFNSINDIKTFVTAANMCPYDIDLVHGRYVVDAKSLMGIFSLDMNTPLDVEVYEDNCGSFLDAIAEFIVS